MRGRIVARIYARRREAIERNVPFWPPGQDGDELDRALDRTGSKLSRCKTKAGQDGQDEKSLPARNSDATTLREGAAREAAPARAHGCDIYPVHPVHPVRASNGAAFSGQDGPCSTLSVLSKGPPWRDDRAWIALWRDAGLPLAKREPIVRAWLAAAPPEPLPPGLASVELRRIARNHGIVVKVAAS